MSAAILQTPRIHFSISSPFHIQRPDNMSPESSSRVSEQSSTSSASSPPDAQLKTFRRLRSSLEQSIRSATKSKSSKLPSVDETGKFSKVKEKVSVEPLNKDCKSKSKMLKVAFRRSGKESPLPPPETPSKHKHKNSEVAADRKAGLNSFLTPSLGQASMSSPALHLYSQPIHNQSVEMISSNSNVEILATPSRHTKKTSLQPATASMEISAPTLLAPRRTSGRSSSETPRDPRTPKHRPPPLLPFSPSTPALSTSRRGSGSSLSPPVPRKDRFRSESPTPSRGNLARSHSGGPSSSQLNFNSPAPSSTSRTMTRSRAGGASSSQLNLDRPTPSPSSGTMTPTRAQSPSASSNIIPSSDNSPRRPLETYKTRRSSIEAQRPSGSSTSARPREVSPTPSKRNFSPGFSQNRHLNASTTSLSYPANPEHRELIRNAASILCKEMLKPSGHSATGLGPMELKEIEVRMRALARLERIWGKSGSSASGSNIMSSSPGLSPSGLSAAGEDRERRLFSEALRDGYVLCQLMNKVQPGSIPRVDKREDGVVRTSNITKFLASCSNLGISSTELFMRDDLIESTSESLARVARTVIAVIQASEKPPPNRVKHLHRSHEPGLYDHATTTRGASSTPNLLQRSISPSAPIPVVRKRWSPSYGLTPARMEDHFDSGNDSDAHKSGGTSDDYDLDEVPPIVTPPPRSPLRPRPSFEHSSVADSRSTMTESNMRQSVASSNMTDSTTYSSLLEVQRTANGQNKFGTIRTVTTDATSFIGSDPPSFTRTEASSIADEIGRKRAGLEKRERKPSETAVVDLSRVAEETEESGTSSRGKSSTGHEPLEREVQKPKVTKSSAVRLGKGKWPDDFFDSAIPTNPNADSSRHLDVVEPSLLLFSESPKPVSVLSASPPRKLAIVGRGNDSAEHLPPFPRRPTHRARHSLDAPSLLSKDNSFRRESSPDDRVFNPTSRITMRRNSSQANAQQNGVYLPHSSLDENLPSAEESAVIPFPRAVSGDVIVQLDRFSFPEKPVNNPVDKPVTDFNEKPRQPRGRFRSDVEGSSSRRHRPSSFDELGANPRRARFESMVNLGASGNASASDLLSRNSLDESVKPTLIVREEGKAATQFQLGNCIGRGQFGAVYRALNLNTGQMVAVKRISLSGLKEEEISQLMKEVDLLKSLSHPGIVKYEGMVRDRDTLSIVLEYAENGSLGQTLKAFGKLNEKLVASYVVKILEGLHYLHRSDVVHCDLKAANILTTKTGNVKLSDFGVSLNLRAMEREMKDVAGTPNWMAPEVIELKGASPKSDIWSLGCTVIELLTGRPPYADVANGMSVMFRIVEDSMPPLPEGISDALFDFLTQCFHKEPSKRPDADILFEHEWLKKNWGLHKELRPQDSIPFLRRVSADLHKTTAVEIVRLLETVEQDSESTIPTHTENTLPEVPESPPIPQKLSNNDSEAMVSGEHSFVKTTFGKPVICRVCLLTVKRSAVLCDQCSLIAHSKCARNAPPTCNLRAQLLLYAQYADKGTPSTDILGQISASPPSDGFYTPRTSLDTLAPAQYPLQVSQPGSNHPPTAFKVSSVFRRSHSFLTPEPGASSSSSQSQSAPSPEKKLVQKPSVLKRSGRTISMSSNSTSTGPSMRSTTTDSREATRRSPVSPGALSEDDETDPARQSRLTEYSLISTSANVGGAATNEIPGNMPLEPQPKKRGSKSKDSGCTVQ